MRNSIKETIQLAKKHQVKVGAHPSFPDPENFGRKSMDIDNEALMQSLCDQVDLFSKVCRSENQEMNHIKLHGALYNLAAKSHEVADIVISAIRRTGVRCKLYTPYKSVLAEKAKPYLEVVNEAFIDRRYHTDLSLVNRS